jgi:hypothetical protein
MLAVMDRGFSRREALWELPLRLCYQIEHISLIEKGFEVTGETIDNEVIDEVLEIQKALNV